MSTETKLTIRDILSKPWDELDKQQVFDQIAEHLLTQSSKSRQTIENSGCSSRCAYRGDEGAKCAIGVLIPDEEYRGDMESKAVYSVVTQFYGLLLDEKVTNFLQMFQGIHDSYDVCAWQRALKSVPGQLRGCRSINTDILDQFTWNEGEQRYVRQ